jgi:hypothetical protein
MWDSIFVSNYFTDSWIFKLLNNPLESGGAPPRGEDVGDGGGDEW